MACSLVLGLPFARADLLILGYHDIGTIHPLTVTASAAELEQQLSFLLLEGYRFVTLPVSQADLTGSLVAVTFDDGYTDIYTQAFPVLERLDVPATVFVVPGQVGQPGFLTWAQLAELREAGWHVGSHSAAHYALTDLTPSTLEAHLIDAATALESYFPGAQLCLAYPFGRHDARVRRAVAKVYPCAVTTAFGFNTGVTEPTVYRRPLSVALADQGLALRQKTGLDARALLFAPALSYWLYPSQAPAGSAAPFYQPARFELMGDGELSFQYRGNHVYQSFFYREGAFAVTGVATRLGTNYSELSGVWAADGVNLAVGGSSTGPLVGMAVPLGGYGEGWGKWGFNQQLAFGVNLLPRDDMRVRLEYALGRGVSGELSYTLPLIPSEGCPIRVRAGYSEHPYSGVSFRLGSMEMNSFVNTVGDVGLGVSFTW